MAFSRRLGVIWIAGASWLLAVGCDDSEDRITHTAGAGEGGEAPSAGKSSVAGSKNEGGNASAGTSSKGGTESGGAGGGDGGDAGHGQTSAGQAGTGAETAGAAGGGGVAGEGGVDGEGGASGSGTGGVGGDGGSAGDGGTIPAIVVPHCSFTCASDDDCLLDGGDDDTQKCNPVRHVCEDPTQYCTLDDECLVQLSQWSTPCANDAACTANTQACVQGNGLGYCATLPSANAPACAGSNVAKTLPRFGAAGTVQVCASADPRCLGNKCRPGCGAPGFGCGAGNGDTCNSKTGLCQCKTGTECTKTGVCGADKHCDTCKTTEDCASTIVDLACVQGHCGCGDPDECIDILGYQNATAQCELL